jgi:putative ABC transport system permease protein
MFILEIIRVALSSLMAGKVRALLTMLGIIVGIGAVIAVISLGKGAQKVIQDKIASMADADLDVVASRTNSFGPGNNFNIEEIRALKSRTDIIDRVMMNSWARDQPVKYGNKTAMVKVVSNFADYIDVYKCRLASGRFFTDADDVARRRVVVVGSDAAKKLGGGPNMVGRTIRYLSADFTIIGVLEPRGKVGWATPDEQVIIPVGAYERVAGHMWLAWLHVKLVDDSDLRGACTEIERIMRHARRQTFDETSNFSTRPTFIDIEKIQQETAETFNSLLLSVAAISLLVGGIGVMNIMLVSVTERTREIGIRKALGARRSAILMQFVLEAVALCIVGGILGVASGIGSVYIFAEKFGWITSIEAESIAISLGFAVAVGLFFGIWPSVRAARMDPVEALCHD